jgi:hypothetical protein
VGIIVEGDAFAGRLDRVFADGFGGPYAEVVDPDRTYRAPRVDEKARDESPNESGAVRGMGGEP